MKYACCWGLTCPIAWWAQLPTTLCANAALSAAPRMNREHKERCEMDWSDKVEAYNIDETCARYHNQSTEVQFHPHSTKFEERWVPPQPHQGILHADTLSQHSPVPSPCPHSSLLPGPAGAAGLSVEGPLQSSWPLRPSPPMALLQLSAPADGQRLGPLPKCAAPYSSPDWPGASQGDRTQGWGIPASRGQGRHTRTTDLQLHTRPVGALGPRPP